MRLLDMIKRLASPSGRVAYTETKVVVEQLGEGVSFALAGWRQGTSGGAFQPGHAWDAVTSVDRWAGCVREGARLEPLEATCAVELRDVLPDLYQPGRIRGDAAALQQVWLRPAPDRCEECRAPCVLVVVRGIDADYVAWSCEVRGETVGRDEVCAALSARYLVPVEFD